MAMNSEDLELEAFQSCMLEALYTYTTAAEIQKALFQNPSTSAFREYIEGFDLEMLEVAALLVKKWGVRSNAADSRDMANMPH